MTDQNLAGKEEQDAAKTGRSNAKQIIVQNERVQDSSIGAPSVRAEEVPKIGLLYHCLVDRRRLSDRFHDG